MPELYNGWFNDQIGKQASTAVSKAFAAGNTNVEVNFPPVPNVEEVKFGTPLNQKFGTNILARDLKVKGGYKPGSDVSRDLISYANVYWAKKLAGGLGGGLPIGGRSACVLTSERMDFSQLQNMGPLSRSGFLNDKARREGRNGETSLCVNTGGEEQWKRLVSLYGSPKSPFIVLNNSYSTSYELGNKAGFEEAYYLKRVSKGWVFRMFPGPWQAYLERPDGGVELLKTYKSKPLLREVANEVREESFKRYSIFNDRWSQGMGGRL
jgi:hypothetical protein